MLRADAGRTLGFTRIIFAQTDKGKKATSVFLATFSGTTRSALPYSDGGEIVSLIATRCREPSAARRQDGADAPISAVVKMQPMRYNVTMKRAEHTRNIVVPERVRLRAEQSSSQTRQWLNDLPGLLAELEQAWELSIGQPLSGGSSAYVSASQNCQRQCGHKDSDAAARPTLTALSKR